MSDVRRGPASPSSTSASMMTSHQQTSPQLLKQLTSPPVVSTANFAAFVASSTTGGTSTPYILTPSASGRSSPSGSPSPARKKLKLDMDAAHADRNHSNRRSSLVGRRQVRLKSVTDAYKDNMAEWFFLQSDGNIVDLPTFRRKPSQLFLTFLTSQSAPNKVIDDVRSRVLGPAQPTPATAVTEPSPSSPATPRSVSSAAMAAALMARAVASGTPLIPSQRLHQQQQQNQPPYSPRAVLLSPVRVGENLQTFSGLGTSTSGMMTPKRGSVFREQFSEKVKQEAWVVKRVNELTRSGVWSDKRLPKVCERPRVRTQWDVLLQEMRWLAVDFHQERQWKKAAAKMLAESAKAYVESLEQRRAKIREAKERRLRRVAGFVSGEVLTFWNDAAAEALVASVGKGVTLADPPRVPNHVDILDPHSEENPSTKQMNCDISDANTGSDVKKCDGLTDDELMDLKFERSTFLNHLKSSNFVSKSSDLRLLPDVDVNDANFNVNESEDDDDDSTIAEQELYESEHTLVDARHELDTLTEDNLKPLESLLRSEYPTYGSNDESDESGLEEDDDETGHSDEEGSDQDEDDDEEEEEFSLEDVEKVLTLSMFPAQRKLYDDYLAGPESRLALERGDAVSISNVVKALRKICNHPSLVSSEESAGSDFGLALSKSFPRVPDLLETSPLVLTATDYNPFTKVDFGALNMIFMQHETTLTAITFDRIRKCCAPKTMIEELPERPKLAPIVPRGRLNIDIHPTAAQTTTTPTGRPQLIPTVNGQHIVMTSSLATDRPVSASPALPVKTKEVNSEAFHKDSLHVIARFNERRCNGMPLYGQDLLDALTVVDVVRPLNRNSR